MEIAALAAVVIAVALMFLLVFKTVRIVPQARSGQHTPTTGGTHRSGHSPARQQNFHI